MIGHLILNCISVSFIKDVRKCIMFCVVMTDMLGEASYTSNQQKEWKRQKGERREQDDRKKKGVKK